MCVLISTFPVCSLPFFFPNPLPTFFTASVLVNAVIACVGWQKQITHPAWHHNWLMQVPVEEAPRRIVTVNQTCVCDLTDSSCLCWIHTVYVYYVGSILRYMYIHVFDLLAFAVDTGTVSTNFDLWFSDLHFELAKTKQRDMNVWLVVKWPNAVDGVLTIGELTN